MKGGKAEFVKNVLMRKGVTGDWQNHMNPEAWKKVDQAFQERLNGVAIAEPLRRFHEYSQEEAADDHEGPAAKRAKTETDDEKPKA